jgi:undecaprenyl-diphosphatase
MVPLPVEQDFLRRALLRVVPLSLVIAVLSLVLLAWIAEEVLEQNTQRFDSAIRGYVHSFATPERTAFMRRATWLGSGTVLAGTVILLALLVSLRERRSAALLAIAMTGAVILDQTLKWTFRRPRPQPFFDIPPPHSYAFPSGHSLMSFCFYSMVGWIIAQRLKKRWQRVAVWCVMAMLIGLVGLSRIYLGVHYPSDVLAGYAAAAMWVGALQYLVPSAEYRARPTADSPLRSE